MVALDTDVLLLAYAFHEAFVTWNARHYRGKTPLAELTPGQYLATV